MRIAHLADLHFGRRMSKREHAGENTREMDIYAAAYSAVDSVIEHSPDVVVFAGDMFDSAHPTSLALQHCYQLVSRIREAGLPILAIAGNHDTVSTWGRSSPLLHLRDHFGCSVAMEQELIEIEGMPFHCIPYRTLSRNLMDTIKWSKKDNILVAHCNVDAPKMPDFAQYDNVRLGKDVLRDDKVILALLGHIHIHQQVTPNAWYCGAPDRLTWGEIDNTPAWLLHTISDGTISSQSVAIAARSAHHIQINCDDLDIHESLQYLLDTLAATHDNFEDSLVKISINNVPRGFHGLPYNAEIQAFMHSKNTFDWKPSVHIRDDIDQTISRGETVEEGKVTALQAWSAGTGSLQHAWQQYSEDFNCEDLKDLGSALIAREGGEA